MSLERTEQDIINKLKEYKAAPCCQEAMTDILLFMGIAEAPIFLDNARIQAQKEHTEERDLRNAYRRHIAKGFKYYLPYDQYKRKKEAGEL